MNQSPEFWDGRRPQEGLHEYLKQYVLWFFDYDYGHSTFLEDYIQDFMSRHRRYGPPKPEKTVSIDKAGKIFGVKEEALKNITIRGLRRLYRRQAQKLHPDPGGEHDKFIKLAEAYQSLLAAKVAETKTRSG
jgi:hypothetical protein